MFNKIWNLLDRYDKIQEPRRFCIFFFPFASYIILMQIVPFLFVSTKTGLEIQYISILPLLLVTAIRIWHLQIKMRR